MLGGSGVGFGSQWSMEGRPTRRFQGPLWLFSSNRSCGVQTLADLFVYAVLIDHKCVPRGQQLSAVLGAEEAVGRGGGRSDTLQMFDSNLELGRCCFKLQSTCRQDHLRRLALPICVILMLIMYVVDVSHLFDIGRRLTPSCGRRRVFSPILSEPAFWSCVSNHSVRPVQQGGMTLGYSALAYVSRALVGLVPAYQKTNRPPRRALTQ